LKLVVLFAMWVSRLKSHPAGVRGLKPKPQGQLSRPADVAPRRGAWIETMAAMSLKNKSSSSHPAGVRGLKLSRSHPSPPT